MANWQTAIRQLHLAKILLDYFQQRGWRVDLITGELYHPDYEARIKGIVADWKADDRAKDTAEWKAEQQRLHSLGERRYPIRGQFNNISRDIFFGNQPVFYLVGVGVSGITLSPFAKVRLSSSYANLFVDLGSTLKGISKNRKRKAIRYGKPLPPEKRREVWLVCSEAVRHYLNH